MWHTVFIEDLDNRLKGSAEQDGNPAAARWATGTWPGAGRARVPEPRVAHAGMVTALPRITGLPLDSPAIRHDCGSRGRNLAGGSSRVLARARSGR